jgi:hypothetical protein
MDTYIKARTDWAKDALYLFAQTSPQIAVSRKPLIGV